jgi:predicted small metal-binding protein
MRAGEGVITHGDQTMGRKYIDCREIPSDSHCTVAISADNEDELLEAAVQHAVAVHHHYNTLELRQLIKRGIREGSPPEVPRHAPSNGAGQAQSASIR